MKALSDICLEVENSLPLWVGGDLEREAQNAVEEHLAQCARCSEGAAKVRAAREVLRRGLRLESERIGAGIDPWLGIREVLRAEGVLDSPEHPVEPRRPTRRVGLPHVGMGWPIAAAVLVGLFLVGTWLPSGQKPPSNGLTDTAPGTRGGTFAVHPAGLRRLYPGEPRLRDSAQVFGEPSAGDEVVPWNITPGSPVSLERVHTPPPK